MPDMIGRRGMLAGVGLATLASAAIVTAPAHAEPVNPADLDTDTFVTPQQFGATGDGTTDDTAAVQAAIDSVLNRGDQRIVMLPPGRYLISSPLRVSSAHSRMKLLGWGTMATHTSQITLGFDGPAIEWEGTLGHIDGVAIVAGGSRTSGMVGVHVHKSANSDDMDFAAVNCNFTSIQVAVRQEGRGLYFFHNLVALCATAVEISWPAAGIEGVGPHVLPYGLRKWLIMGNHFHTPSDYAIKFHGESDGDFRAAIIADNLMDIGRRLFWGSLTNSTITGNIVENNSRTSGPDGTGPAPVVYVAAGGHGVTITGNHFGGFEVPPGGVYDASWQGIWPMGERAIVFGPNTDVHHTTINGNTFSWLYGSPVVAESGLSDSTVTGNTFEGWNQSSSDGEAALLVIGDATRVTVTGNALGESPTGEPPIRVVGTLRHSTIVANTHVSRTPVVAGAIDHSRIELLPAERDELPSARGLKGATVIVIDAPGHHPALAISDGSAWNLAVPGTQI